MKIAAKSGAVLAAAALSLAFAGVAAAPVQAQEAKIHCSGVNSCKGTSECKTAASSCKGQNGCKGQGWLSVTKAECDAQGGKVVEG